MNYSNKYHLPQWEKSDRVLMEDFNNAMAAIEAGMAGNREAAAEAARLPYATGTYEGNGGTTFVEVGFRPRFVIISDQFYNGTGTMPIGMVVAGTQNLHEVISYSSSGFTVTEPTRQGNYDLGYPRPNTNGKTYNYIAFR